MTSILPFARASLPDTTAQPGMPASPEAKKYIVANLIYPILQTFTGGQSVSKEEITATVALWTDVLTGFAPEAYSIAARMMLMERKDRFRPVPAEVREYLERAEAGITGKPLRRRWAPDARVVAIAFNRITGADANAIMDAVPEACSEDVRAALVEISDAFQSKGTRYAVERDDVPIKQVIAKAIDRLRRTVLYRIYGDPEHHAGGQAALESTWCAISKQRIDQWRAEFPKALHDGEQDYYLGCEFSKLCGADPKSYERYGRGLQQEIEDKLRSWMADAHDRHVKEEETERQRAEERTRTAQERQERERQRWEQQKRDEAKVRLSSEAREAALARPDVAAAKRKCDDLHALRPRSEATTAAHSEFVNLWLPAFNEELIARGVEVWS